MNSQPAFHDSPVAQSTNAIAAHEADTEAANDDVAEETVDSGHSPLSIIAIGMACFFGTAALIMAVI